MKQEITFSPEIFEFISKDSQPLDADTPQKLMMGFIKQNYFVLDKKKQLTSEYANVILSLPDSNIYKSTLKLFVDGLINNKGKHFVEYPLEAKEDLVISLTEYSQDHILCVSKRNEYCSKIHSNTNIELHDFDSFLYPEPNHKLKHLPTIIPLKEGVFYDIINILRPFLQNAKYARIEDPYLPNPLASENVFEIIKTFQNINYKLIMFPKELYCGQLNIKKKIKQYDKFIKKVDHLCTDGYKIDTNEQFRIKKHRERYIFTEDYQIYVPGGFDCIKRNGYLEINNDKDITDRKEIRIEKRQFEMAFE